MALTNSIVQSTGDLRSAAVEQRRSKERRVKYRNVNVALLGQPQNPFTNKKLGAPCWNDKNKFKMTRDPSLVKVCHCCQCRGWNTKELAKKRAARKLYFDDEICTARTNPLSPSAALEDRWEDSSSDNDSIAGIAYSYDQSGPRAGTDTLSYAVTEAVKKFEHKELTTLIKNEYEVVDYEDSDEEFELV
ncbi:uncharacterized protein LAJ45_01950 [Morchella importuna]|uniref:uncharacterized protein n=1 Tax=Morchella importuna TaxID=1174673 RepID=UPI001E8EE863|nr:uncharacterized protein LAJ45_01950 [Morchella importuna]KAH8154182.1 hypothetical protein LAJ45_01950 [Morchella importuna]